MKNIKSVFADLFLIQPLSLVAAFSLILLSPELVFAETAVIYPSKDNTIFAGTQFENNSCGAGTGMIAGNTKNGLTRRGLVMFDIASVIPPGATITA